MTGPANIAAPLKAWRARMTLTQAKAAAMMRVPLNTYSRWEMGSSRAKLAELILRLAWHLEGCPPDSPLKPKQKEKQNDE